LIRTEAEATASAVDYRPTEHVEFVLLVIPDVNGSLRGKALRPTHSTPPCGTAR